MRNIYFPLPVPTSAGAGAAQIVRDLREKYIQVGGTFSATFSIEGSLDGGTTWGAIQSGINAAGWHSIPHPLTHIRVVTSSYTSGTPRVVLAGFDVNG